jgi:hypothetical protein
MIFFFLIVSNLFTRKYLISSQERQYLFQKVNRKTVINCPADYDTLIDYNLFYNSSSYSFDSSSYHFYSSLVNNCLCLLSSLFSSSSLIPYVFEHELNSNNNRNSDNVRYFPSFPFISSFFSKIISIISTFSNCIPSINGSGFFFFYYN